MKKSSKIIALIASVLAGLTVLGLYMTRKLNFANAPSQLTMRDWKKVMMETKDAIVDKKITFFAAGVAYFATLAFFPLLVALVAIGGMVIDETQLSSIVSVINQYAPQDLASLITTQLENASSSESGHVITAALAILISLFSVSGAAQNLIQALNTSYDVSESRGFVKLRLYSVVLTLGLVVFIGLVLALLVVNSTLLSGLGVPTWLAGTYPVLRWLSLIGLVLVALAVLYRYAPDRGTVKWQWVSWGSMIATMLWTIVTVGFFVYVQNFANFSDTYSLFAGIIVLMVWLNLSTLMVLVGAQVNSCLEAQTVLPTISK